MATMPTPKRQLADLLTPGGLDNFVAERRDRDASWRSIALDLFTATDGKVNITPESLRLWYGIRPEKAKAS